MSTSTTTVNDNNTTANIDLTGNNEITASNATINANNSTGCDTIDIDNSSSATVNFNNSQGTDAISISSSVVSTTVNLNNSSGDDDSVEITGTTSVAGTVNLNNSTGTGDKVDITATTVNATVNMNNSGGSDDVCIDGAAVTATVNLNNSGGSDNVEIIGTSSTTATVNLNNSYGDDTIQVGSVTGITNATVNLNGSGGIDEVNIVGSQNTATVNLTNSTGGGFGDRVILAGAGTGVINAANSTGANTLIGGNTTDTITGGGGGDTLDLKGAGTIKAGAGNDLGIYTLSDHYTLSCGVLTSKLGDADYYYGGAGANTLRIVVTAAEYAVIQSQLADYKNWLTTNPGGNQTFYFNFASGKDSKTGLTGITQGNGPGTGGGLAVSGWQVLQVSIMSEALQYDTGASRTDKITSKDTLVGTATPGATVTLTEGTTALGTAVADSTGAWSFTPSGLTDGVHTIVASETDGSVPTTSSSLSFTLDTTPPSLPTEQNQTAEATGPNGAAVSFASTGPATDLVDGTDPVSFYEGDPSHPVSSGQTFALGTHTITETATDHAGNPSTDSFTITVRDTTAPVISGAANQTDEATGPNGAAAVFSASASDIVDGSDPVVFTEGSAVVHSGDTFSLGTHTITETATDHAGNPSTDSFTITVRDTTAPVISGAANQTDEATGPNGAAAVFSASASDIVDGSDPVVFTEGSAVVHSGDTFSLGTHTITETATDHAGNPSTDSFTITVRDTTAPVISGAANQTDEATGPNGAAAVFSASASDIVDGSDPVVFTEGSAVVHSGDTFSLGTHTITETATDHAGNPSTDSFTITVRDTTAPVISGAANQTDEATGPNGAAAVFSASASDIVDGSDPVVFTEGSAVVHSGDTFSLGTHTITETATDHAGNPSTDSFTITVRDTTAPVISGAANQTDEATGPNGAAAVFSASASDIVDGSDPVVFTEGSAVVHSGDTFSLGTHTITETATDHAGNPSTDSFTITVRDTTAPVISGAANQTDEATGPNGAAAVFSASASDIVDGSDPVVFTEGSAVVHSGDTFSLGTHTITETATDHAGNPSTDSFTITVRDTTAPVISGAANQTDEATGPNGAAAVFSASASDIVDGSDPVVFTEGSAVVHSGDTFSLGTHTITETATDHAGNPSTDSFTITVRDTTAPVISGAANQTDEATGPNGAAAVFSASASDIVDGSDPVVFTEGSAVVHSGDTFSLGTHTITETATDHAGNPSTDSFTITVRDTTAPVISGAANQTDEATGPNGAAAVFSASASDIVDGSDPVVFTEGSAVVHSGDTFSLGTHTITETATDHAGNPSTDSFTITVRDTTAPVISGAANQTDEATGPNGAAAVFSASASDIVDGSDPVVFTEGSAVVHSGDTFSLGTHTITETATDHAGNPSTDSFTITVRDTTAPVISGAANQTDEATGPNGAAAVFSASASDIVDGSDPVVFTEGSAVVHSGDTFSLGTHTITETATDHAGNPSTDSFTITVRDTTAPVISGAANQTDEATGPNGAAAVFSASASDIVDGSDPVVFTEGSAVVHSGDTFSLGTHTITETATDHAGNPSTDSFTITVRDTTAPVISGAANQTDEATGPNGAAAVFSASASDIVDGSDPVVFTEGSAVVHSGDTFSLGTHTITETATDHAGNPSTDSFTITVRDTTAPVISGAANQTDEATGPNGAAAVFSASASDIVDGSDPVVFTEGSAVVHSGDTFSLGTHTITETATDHAGNPSTDSFTITVRDTTAPVISGAANQTDEATGPNGAAAVFSASASDIVDGSDPVVFTEGSAVVHSGDTFSLGTHTITETATDHAGNPSTDSFTITVRDTTAPVISGAANQTDEATGPNGAAAVFSASASDIVDGSDPVVFTEGSAVVHSGDTFSLGTHTITETATDHAGNPSTDSFTITVRDTTAPVISGAANQTDEATGPNGAAAVFSASASDIVDGSDPVVFTEGSAVVHSGDTFSLGTHTITETATDHAGNPSTDSFTITVRDTTAPVISGAANQTDEATGPNGAAAVFSASASDIVDGSDPVVFTEGSAVVHSGDTFSLGTHTITETATDHAGNPSTDSFTITVRDTTAPTETFNTTIITDTGATGTISSGGVTKDNTLGLSGTASDSGSGVASVHVFDGATDLGAASINGTDWSFTTAALSDGMHSFTTKATDNAGNTFTTSPAVIATVDRSPPAQPSAPSDSAVSSGYVSATNDTTVQTLTGTAEANSTVTIYNNSTQITTVAANGSGNWSYALGHLADGAYSYTVTATDAAGNVSAASAALTFAVDTTPPAAPVITGVGEGGAVDPNDNTVSGQSGDKTVTGTAEANSTVSVIFGGSSLGTATANGSGNWTYTLTAGNITTIGQGSGKSVTATATDAAGNTGPASTAFNFSVDTIAPAAPVITGVGEGGAVDPNDNTVSGQSGDKTVTGTAEANSTVSVIFGGSSLGTATANGSGNWTYTLTAGNITTIGQGSGKSVTATATDAAGNTGPASSAFSFSVDTVAPATDTWNYSTSNKNITVTTDTTGIAKVSAVDNSHPSTTIPDGVHGTGATWTIASGNVNGDSITVTVWDAAGNSLSTTHTAPAGIAGTPINLGLNNPSGVGALTTIMISDVPSDWSLNQGTDNGNGTWNVTSSDPSSLYVTTAAGFAGAIVLNVSMSWTNADGSTGNASIADNVEAYPASPIFAVSGDDTLTGGQNGNNEFVFAQPIGNDTIYNFNTASGTIDLIGFGLGGFGALAIGNDASGNAVVTLGSGETITIKGVASDQLRASNFVFDEEPVSTNAGTMTVGDGAILPLGGTVENTGVIAVNSTGDESDLEIQVRGVTLEGGGQLTLSDNSQNVIFGGDASAVLDNIDNTISGAGELGQGQLTLHNEGTIAATGTNALVIDTEANAVINSGTLRADGAGGLVVDSALEGGGAAVIGAGSRIEFGAAADAAVSFDAAAAGTLKLDQSGGFTGTIAGFAQGDGLDLADGFSAGATLGYAANASGTGGTLTVGDGTHTTSLALLGQYAVSGFQAASDQGGGTIITYTPPQTSTAEQSLLSNPQHTA